MISRRSELHRTDKKQVMWVLCQRRRLHLMQDTLMQDAGYPRNGFMHNTTNNSNAPYKKFATSQIKP